MFVTEITHIWRKASYNKAAALRMGGAAAVKVWFRRGH